MYFGSFVGHIFFLTRVAQQYIVQIVPLGNLWDGKLIMSILKDVLKDEYERLKSLERWYNHEIASLPIGSISIKRRKGREYLYINYRHKEKVKSDYVGYVSSEKSSEMISKIKKKKRI